MTDLPTAKPTRSPSDAETTVLNLGQPVAPPTSSAPPTGSVPAAVPVTSAAEPPRDGSATSVVRAVTRPNMALVVLVGMGALAIAFIVMIIVGVTGESINALAVIATPIASMVAAYYGITLSIQQVKNERIEKEKALARAEAADVARREIEVWSAQMESGLRVAMAKLTAARVGTDEVTRAAGTPDDFF
ncbi:hypothetical protein [Cryobacterium sp. MLB-32]|uniref:hypothetical protein n=1 Tax=Cryobacterium sp. MLB-32 TaxID=1529318 RepID=UPI0012E09575|nr:hypothetical protein [Cryobacterium sp. MLB-32]